MVYSREDCAREDAGVAVGDQLRDFALSLPEAVEEFPWGDRVMKVNKKIFVFLGDKRLGLKLPASCEAALSIAGAAPMGYGLGKANWVVIPLDAPLPPRGVLEDWIVESYRAVAPKRCIAQLAP
jgi:predicted DNA-binding protein (MmcQ/YjbR family)